MPENNNDETENLTIEKINELFSDIIEIPADLIGAVDTCWAKCGVGQYA